MIKLKHVVLPSPEQMEFVIEGMRNPMNSWDKSDSLFNLEFSPDCGGHEHLGGTGINGLGYWAPKEADIADEYYVGPNDLSLMQKLAKAGTDHRKFMRMMPLMMRITAPLYWWKEFDTYKVGTVANSCSTMHKITEKEFTIEDFSHEYMLSTSSLMARVSCFLEKSEDKQIVGAIDVLATTIDTLNALRNAYIAINKAEFNDADAKKDLLKMTWNEIIQLLPSSYNQTRNVMLNYEVLANIYKSRKNHKLDEWRQFCEWIEELPYSELITGLE